MKTKWLFLPPDWRRGASLSSYSAQSLTWDELFGSASGKQLSHHFNADC